MTGDSRGQWRLFVALDLPAGAKAALAAAGKELQGLLPAGVRWVNPEGIHLTLKFLGATEAGRVDELLAALEEAAAAGEQMPFPLHLDGLGVFPNYREPRVIWAGVGGDLDSLAKAQRRVEQAMARLGFPEESRAFRPHLTLGRVRDGVAPATRRQIGDIMASQAAALAPEYEWQAGEIHLIRSNLTPQGAVYTPLGSAAWGAAEGESYGKAAGSTASDAAL